MEEHVLVFPSKIAQRHAPADGFSQDFDGFLRNVENKLSFRPRTEIEGDARYKQLIPFVIIRRGGQIMRHLRGSGDDRLAWSWSLGIGGHINPGDVQGSLPFYRRAMLRELHEEVRMTGPYSTRLVGIVNDNSDEVGRTHLGLVFLVELDYGEVKPCEDGLVAAGFEHPDDLRSRRHQFENWSRHLLELDLPSL